MYGWGERVRLACLSEAFREHLFVSGVLVGNRQAVIGLCKDIGAVQLSERTERAWCIALRRFRDGRRDRAGLIPKEPDGAVVGLCMWILVQGVAYRTGQGAVHGAFVCKADLRFLRV